MSSTALVRFKNYEIWESKSPYDSEILRIYTERDLKINITKEQNNIVEEANVYFVSELGNLLDRLRIVGFREDYYVTGFEEKIESEIRSINSIINYLDKDAHKNALKNIKLLQSSTIEDYNIALRHIIDKQLYRINPYKGGDQVCRYLLENGIYNHPAINFSFHNLIFTLGQLYSKDEKIIFDVNEFVDYNYFWESTNFHNVAIEIESLSNKIGEKIIILTEGKSDINILESSIEVLYPHLSDYYYFMDFHSPNVPGGASYLVQSIKSFIGAGINNKIIAIFDNDTGAKEALRSLDNVKIPKNIVILKLPNLSFAESYPTIGPTGDALIDVNGLAGSIELYLGVDIIQEDGKFIPIQLTGYSPKINAYQGEILYKDKIQKDFFNLLKKIKKNKINKEDKDWSGIKLIFEAIFDAFSENNAQAFEYNIIHSLQENKW